MSTGDFGGSQFGSQPFGPGVPPRTSGDITQPVFGGAQFGAQQYAPGVGSTSSTTTSASSTFAVTIAGQPVTGIQIGTMQISRELNQRWTAQFVVYSTGPSVSDFVAGYSVIINDTLGNRLFTGTIETLSELMGQDKAGIDVSQHRWWTISCVSHEKILDRHVAMGRWYGQTMGYIARYLVNTYLAADGVGASDVQDGPIVPILEVSSLTKISDIFQQLSTVSGYPWYVETINTNTYDVHMFDPAGGPVVFSLTDGTAFESIDPVCDLTDYRNRQYISIDQAERAESFAGSGSSPQTLTTANEISSVVSITVDGVLNSVGLTGDTGKQWYYTVNANTITQDAGGTAIPATSTIAVRYVPRNADTFNGTGSAGLVMTTSKTIGTVNSIVLNGGNPSTFGIQGQTPPGSVDFLYTPNGNTVSEDPLSPAVYTSSDTIVVDYQPAAGYVMKENVAEQNYRASIEGGSGIHEAVDSALSNSTLQDANALCAKLLSRYGTSQPGSGRFDVRELSFRVTTAREPDAVLLTPGQRVNVDLGSRRITGNFLISGSAISDVGGVTMAFDVRLTRDQFTPDYETFFDQQPSVSTTTQTTAQAAVPVTSGPIAYAW